MASILDYLPKAGNVVGRPRDPSITQKASVPAVVPIPIMGLNTRDGLGDMDANYAVDIQNFIPTQGKMITRKPSKPYVDTGTGQPVGTIFSHGDSLYAISNGRIFDITNPGNVSTLVDAATTGLANEAWHWATLNGYTILCSNETNTPITIAPDGSTPAHGWAAAEKNGAAVAPLDVRKLFNPLTHRNRIFFLEKDSNKVWYGDLLAIRGPLNFAPINVNGATGNPIAMEVLTVDGAIGLNDRLAIFLDSGQMVLYTGIDPSGAVADEWHQEGTYQFGDLLGDRSVLRFGPDLAVLTNTGVVSVLNFQNTGGLPIQENRTTIIPDTIQSIFSRMAKNNPGFLWWQSVYLRSTDPPMLLFNFPFGEQAALNVQTMAWTRFDGMDATCWYEYKGNVYYGTENGLVRRAFQNFGDEIIQSRFQTAFSDFSELHQGRFTFAPKFFRSLRVTVESSQAVDFKAGFALDYNQLPTLNTVETESQGRFLLGEDAVLGEAILAPPRVRETVHLTGITNPVGDLHGLPTKAAVVIETTVHNAEFEVAGLVAQYVPTRK